MKLRFFLYLSHPTGVDLRCLLYFSVWLYNFAADLLGVWQNWNIQKWNTYLVSYIIQYYIILCNWTIND
jgi:hypothetical protein